VKDNVFGIPVTVQPRAAALASLAEAGDEPVVYGVVRCIDLPAAAIREPIRSRNRRTPCDNCHEICWYDPEHAIPGLRVLCNHCRPAIAEYYMTAEQLAEIRKIHGA
jgi:hypothetical protein